MPTTVYRNDYEVGPFAILIKALRVSATTQCINAFEIITFAARQTARAAVCHPSQLIMVSVVLRLGGKPSFACMTG